MQKVYSFTFMAIFIFLSPFSFSETIFLCIFARTGVVNTSLFSKSHTK